MLLAAAALAVYWGAWGFEFVNFDDEIALAGAERAGVDASSRASLIREVPSLFRYERGREYLPVRDASYVADRILYGRLAPGGLHATNLALHVANGLLVCALATLLGISAVGALFAGGVFLLHPIQVEAVAWVSGRKDLLAAFFVLLSWHAFERRKPALSAIAFLAAGLSKATVVFLPVVLVVSRALGGRSDPGRGDATRDDAAAAGPRIGRSLRDVAPHAVVAVAVAVLQIRTSAEAGMLREPGADGAIGAVVRAATLAVRYLRNVVWPVDLHLLYEPTLSSPTSLAAWGAAIGLALLAVIAARIGRERPPVPLGLAAFFLLLLPTLGLVPFQLLMADRYAYLPLAGLAIGAAALVDRTRADAGRAAVAARAARFVDRRAAALALLVPLALVARAEVPAWRDSEALWKREIARDPRHAEGWANLGEHYLARGRAAEAADALAQAATRRPDSVPILTNWALAASRAGRHGEALAAIASAKERAPDDPLVRYNAACVRAAAGDVDGALEDLSEAILDGFRNREALASDPDLAPLRADPRFSPLVAEFLPGDARDDAR